MNPAGSAPAKTEVETQRKGDLRADHATENASTPATPAPTGKDQPADPSPAVSSSAPASTQTAAERERIVREAMDAGIPEQEARHIVTHHSLKAAHSLLLAAAKKRLHAAA